MANIDKDTALTQILALAQQQEALAKAGLAYTPPPQPQPPPLLDIKDYLMPQSGRYVRPVFVSWLADGRIPVWLVRPNAPQPGYPMDTKVITADGLFDRITDYPGHWTDPKAFRLYTNSTPGSTQLGFKLAPRTYDPTQGRIQVSSYMNTDPTQITTQSYANGVPDQPLNTAQAQVFFELRKGVDFKGQLGVQDPLVSIYQYNWSTQLAKKLKMAQEQEEFYWVLGSSWAQWIHYQLQPDASYLQDNIALYNTFVPDTTTVPVFPCNVAL